MKKTQEQFILEKGMFCDEANCKTITIEGSEGLPEIFITSAAPTMGPNLSSSEGHDSVI